MRLILPSHSSPPSSRWVRLLLTATIDNTGRTLGIDNIDLLMNISGLKGFPKSAKFFEDSLTTTCTGGEIEVDDTGFKWVGGSIGADETCEVTAELQYPRQGRSPSM